MSSPNRAVAIIDANLDSMLKYPHMWAAGNAMAFELLVINYLCLRCEILELHVNWRPISQNLLVEMTGKNAGACGPNSRLREYYGESSFEIEDPNHGNYMLHYRELVSRVRDACEQAMKGE